MLWFILFGIGQPVAVATPLNATGIVGQDLLNYMEDLFPELQLQPGEVDVNKGLRCLNAAMRLFESNAAQYTNFLGGQIGYVTTAQNVEFTPYPTGLLRVDRLDFIEPTTNYPSYRLTALYIPGSHSNRYRFFPFNLIGGTLTSGAPRSYWTDGRNFYWDPIPDNDYSVRWYGYLQAPQLTAAGTFQYPEIAAYPIAVVAARMSRMGLDDDISQYVALGKDVFNPLLDAMGVFNADAAPVYEFAYSHDT